MTEIFADNVISIRAFLSSAYPLNSTAPPYDKRKVSASPDSNPDLCPAIVLYSRCTTATSELHADFRVPTFAVPLNFLSLTF